MALIKDRFCFIGGDRRQRFTAEILAEAAQVNVIGDCYSDCVKCNVCSCLPKALHNCEIIVLPLPASKIESVISFDELISAIEDKEVLVLGGKFSQYMKQLLTEKGIRNIDYYGDEAFALKNAFLTAEGALSYAMNSYDGDLKTARIAIIGYGRIGSALGELLKGLLCRNVTVFARRDEALVMASERGLQHSRISPDTVFDFDLIFNTVPTRVITDKQILDMNGGTVLIELASAPGGFDSDIAEQSGLAVVKAPGVPGTYAPKTAGRILSETITELLTKEVSL